MTPTLNLPLAAPRWSGLAISLATIVASALLFVLTVGWLDPALPLPPQQWDAATWAIAALNALPALALLVLVLALTRRPLLSIWLVLLCLQGLYAINAAKLTFLETPLLPADLGFLKEPGPALQLFEHYAKPAPHHIAIFAVLLLVTIVLWRRRRIATLAGWRRVAMVAGVVLVGTTLVAGSAPWRTLYNRNLLKFEPWALLESVGHAGLISSLLLYHWETPSGDIPRADRAAALDLLSAHAPELRGRLAAAGADEQRPDIVVVQSESLFDPSRLRGVADGSFLPEFRKLLPRAAVSGNMRVPTFGGGTIRTEFEVLTGAPLASLGGIQYPWLEVERKRLPGLVRILGGHGYRTIAIHPNSAAFWNRNHAFPALGFDRFIDSKGFDPNAIVGLFTSDAALTDRIVEELGDDDTPRFIFAISMENHGPFDWRPGLDAQRLAAIPMPDQLDAGGRLWFGNYLYLLQDADHELGRLAKIIQQRKRRTLFLFYGDHLPALAPVYFQLGFDDGQDAKTQPVPWLLLDTADPHPRRLDTRSWLLPALLLDSAGVADDPYFAVIDTLRESIGLDDGALDPADEAGLYALARLHLRGELDAVLAEALAESPPTDPP